MVIITQFDGNTGAKKIAQRGTKFMKNYKLNSTNELTSYALFSCQEIDFPYFSISFCQTSRLSFRNQQYY